MRAISWFRHRTYSLLLPKEAYFPCSKLLVDAWHSAFAEAFQLTSCTPAYAPCRWATASFTYFAHYQQRHASVIPSQHQGLGMKDPDCLSKAQGIIGEVVSEGLCLSPTAW